eukprot:m.4084 g.4084  ORF g.4084 m.4084 type:complete len:277 (+) comp2166_c0_seq1:37-867(+)
MEAVKSVVDGALNLFLGRSLEGPLFQFGTGSKEWPSPVGLSLGLASVAVGQAFVIAWFYWRREILKCKKFIQKEHEPYTFAEGVKTHLAQPEGFILLGSYLSGTWMFNLMPSTYYDLTGGINWFHVFAQLAIVDFIQTLMHLAEHDISPKVYRLTHKPHHRWLNPRLFDAFNGSFYDTIFMILFPLYMTALIVRANVWSYMAFGTIYANYLCLIHSEFPNPWDPIFLHLGIGTAADHHVHHRLFKFNFGHLFMWWDKLFGTYKSPKSVTRFDQKVL